MFGAEKGKARTGRQELHIGIVQARFNESITNTLAACRASCWHWACRREHRPCAVPGALEVPVALQAWPSATSTTP
jgi:6,7-dimethyl-8-ribityllumazine synthase